MSVTRFSATRKRQSITGNHSTKIITAGLAALACAAGFLGGGPAYAEGDDDVTPLNTDSTSVSVDVSVTADGTATWSQSSAEPGVATDADNSITETDGYDAGPNNGVVRVNDYIAYTVNLNLNTTVPVNDFTVNITFPQGTQVDTSVLDATCPYGYNVDPPTTGLENLMPIDDSTYSNLNPQTVTCHLGNFAAQNKAFGVDFSVLALNAAANNQPLVMGAASVTVANPEDATDQLTFTDPDPTVSINPSRLGSTTVLASSRLMWDISKNAEKIQANTGRLNQLYNPCSWDTAQMCVMLIFNRYISSPTAKGAMPAVGPVTYSDDLSIRSLFPTLSDDDYAAIEANLDAYGPRLQQNLSGFVSGGPSTTGLGAKGTDAGSVTNSGTTIYTDAITNARVDGTNKPVNGLVNGTITGADFSLSRVPTANTQSQNPALSAYSMPDPSVAYAVAGYVGIVIPIATFTTFYTQDGGNGSYTIDKVNNSYTNFSVKGLTDAETDVQATETTDTQPASQGYSDGKWNDYRWGSITVQVGQGDFNALKGFYGAPGFPNSSPFRQGYDGQPGPAAGGDSNWVGYYQSGQIRTSPGATVTSQILTYSQSKTGISQQSALVCDSWDNSQLQLKGSDKYTGTFTSVWPANTNLLSDFQIEYSGTAIGGTGADSTCDTGDWYDSPEAVDAAANVQEVQQDDDILYPAVTRVRIFIITTPPSSTDANNISRFIIGLQVMDDPSVNYDGANIPNYLSWKVNLNGGDLSLEELLADDDISWMPSDYNPGTTTGDTGTYGDRLIVTTALVRLSQGVQQATAAKDFIPAGSDTATAANIAISAANGDAPDEAIFTLRPTLSDASGAIGNSQTVYVEDCLPAGLTFTGATQNDTPLTSVSQVAVGGDLPEDSEFTSTTCDMSKNSYLRFTLTGVDINSAIPPIIMTTTPSADADPGTYANKALVSSPADSSPLSVRQTTTSVTMVAAPTVQLFKQAVEPVIQVNRANEDENGVYTQPEGWQNQYAAWDITLKNTMDEASTITNPDIIDILPFNPPTGPKKFHGTLMLAPDVPQAVAVTDSDPNAAAAKVLYSASDPSTMVSDPTNADANGANGTTVWCNSYGIAAQKVSGNGSDSDCPATLEAVTAIRVMRAGEFKANETITIHVIMLGLGNQNGDIYTNEAAGHADGLTFIVGPIKTPVTVAGGGIGDVVWNDVNGNGLQDVDAATGEPTEPGINGAKVTLTGKDDLGNAVNLETTTAEHIITNDDETTTTVEGWYHFDNLRTPDKDGYKVQVTIQKLDEESGQYVTDEDAVFTTLMAGNSTYTDSNADQDGWMTTKDGDDLVQTIHLGQGVNDLTWDAGVYWPGTVGDRVWQDVNGNGIQDDGEPNLAGVLVCISGDTGAGVAVTDPNAAVIDDQEATETNEPDATEADPDATETDSTEPAPYCVTTGDDGAYSFTVPPSSEDGYTVTFDTSNLPGINFTTAGVRTGGGTIANDSDAVADENNPALGTVTGIVIQSGDVNNDIDAGLVGTVVPNKSADPPEGDARTPGETITYTLAFSNSTAAGAPVNYTDDMTALLDDADLNADTLTADEGLTVTLAEDGKSFTITGSVPAGTAADDPESTELTPTTLTVTYTITIKDGGDGVVGNWLYQTPGDGGETPPPPDYTTTDGQDACLQDDLCTVHFIPKIDIVKSGDVAKDAVKGDTVTWTFTIENTGPVALTSFTLEDTMAADAHFAWGDCTVRPGAEDEIVIAAGEPITGVVLQPKEQIVCTGTSQVTQADIDQRQQPNPDVTVTAISVPPTPTRGWVPTWTVEGEKVQAQSKASVPLDQHPAISLVKDVDKSQAALDDVVTFTITATNTGDTTLVNVVIDDPLDGLSDLNCTWPDAEAPNVLPVDTAAVCTATYTITADDVNNGGVTNVATVTGYTPDIPGTDGPDGTPAIPGTQVQASDDAAVTALKAPTGGEVANGYPFGLLAAGILLLIGAAGVSGAVVLRRRA